MQPDSKQRIGRHALLETCFIFGPCKEVVGWQSSSSPRLRSPEVDLTFNGQNIPFVNHVKYLGVIFDDRITWRLHTEMTEAKAFRIFLS
jgi:hypothetical protein